MWRVTTHAQEAHHIYGDQTIAFGAITLPFSGGSPRQHEHFSPLPIINPAAGCQSLSVCSSEMRPVELLKWCTKFVVTDTPSFTNTQEAETI